MAAFQYCVVYTVGSCEALKSLFFKFKLPKSILKVLKGLKFSFKKFIVPHGQSLNTVFMYTK